MNGEIGVKPLIVGAKNRETLDRFIAKKRKQSRTFRVASDVIVFRAKDGSDTHILKYEYGKNEA